MKTIVAKTGILAMALLAIAACGGTSNPIEEYKDLKTVPRNGDRPVHTKDEPRLLIVEVDGPNAENNGNFVEGQEGIIRLHVRVLKPGVILGYKINVASGPGGQTLTPTTESDVWSLRWTPPRGYTSFNKSGSAVFDVDAYVTQANDVRLVGNTDRSTIKVTVSRNTAEPVILGTSLASNIVLNEGDVVPFSVDVKDPSGTGLPPDLKYVRFDGPESPHENPKGYRANGAAYIRNSEPFVQKLGDGLWRFNLVFDLRETELIMPVDQKGVNKTTDDLQLCFNIQAVNTLGNWSHSEMYCRQALYSAQTPEITWEGDQQKAEIYAGESNVLKFTVKTRNNQGDLTIQNLSSNFSNWMGHPQMDCSAADANSGVRNCQIQWAAECSMAKKTYIITINATNKAAGKTKATRVQRNIVVVAKPDTCKAPEPAKPVAKPATKPGAKPTAPAVSRNGGAK